MSSGAVLIIVPALGRPHHVAPLLESIETNTPAPHRTLFVCSPHDFTVHDAVRAVDGELVLTTWDPGHGDYARKINLGYRISTEPLLFLGATDLRFHREWLERAVAYLEPGVGVVGTNDLGNSRVLRGVHSTHTLVTREYVDTYGTIDEPGKVLHEGYWHEYCDDEFVETSWKREAWAFAHDSIVEHLHPAWGKGEMDAMYAQEGRRMRHGRRLFLRRRPLWVPNGGPDARRNRRGGDLRES